jgi:hypothetical protein
MIQRIQSIYLLLSGVAILLMLVFKTAVFPMLFDVQQFYGISEVPAGTPSKVQIDAEVDVYGVTLSAAEQTAKMDVPKHHIEQVSSYAKVFTIGRTVLIVMGFLPLIFIFLYKKLPVQKKLVGTYLFGCFVFSAAMIYIGFDAKSIVAAKLKAAEIGFAPQIGYYMPFVSMAFAFLAWRAIARDWKLIKSVDRLR